MPYKGPKSNLNTHEKNMVQMFQNHVDRNGGIPFMLNMDKREGELTIQEWAQWRLWRVDNDLDVVYMDQMRRTGGRYQVPCQWPDEFDAAWTRQPTKAHLEVVRDSEDA